MIRLEPVGTPFAGLLETIERLHNPTPDMQDEVGDAVRQGAYRSFNWQGSRGGAWLGLARVTQLERVRLGYPPARPILVRSGAYMRSFTNRNDPNHIQDYQATGEGWALEVGSRDERAPVLEFGLGPIPPRPVLDLHEPDEEHILDVIDGILARIEAAMRD